MASGLIDPPKASDSAPTTVGASEWSVTPDQTVEGRVESITKKSSPLMQLAETRATAKMNERGLLNSSMAIGAGQTALYEAAMPMAQQDAATFARAGEFNTSQKNQFGLQANDQVNALGRLDKQQAYTQANLAMQQGYDISKMGLEQQNILSRMTVTQQNELAKLAVSQGYTLQNMTAQQINDLQKMTQSQSYTEKNAATAAAVQAERDQVAIKADKETAATLAKTTAERDAFAVNAAKDSAAKLAETQQKFADVQIAANKASALFSANVQSELAQLNHDNAAILNKSNYAVGAMSKYSDALNNIAMSTMSQEAKNQAQANAFTAYKDQLRLISSLGNVQDLSTLLNFSSTETPTSGKTGLATNDAPAQAPNGTYKTTTPDRGLIYTPYAGSNGLINSNPNVVYQ